MRRNSFLVKENNMQLADVASTHYQRPLLKSPFFPRQRPLIETDTYIPWTGYSSVDVFSSVEQEYFSIRNSVSLFDLTPMVKYRVHGADAEAYLDRMVTRDVKKIKPLRVGYTVWCNDAGHVIDDGTIFRLGETEFRICTAERQLDWFLDSAIGFDVEITEVTQDIAALALQGPTSCSVLKVMGLSGIERLKPFDIGHFTFGDAPLMISRTGFTGDLGYELWIDSSKALALWDALMLAGHSRGIRPIGYQALEMARIEAGFILPNVEFTSAEHTIRLQRDRSPFELGLDWLVDLKKGHFNGKRALLVEKEKGSRQRLVGIEIEGNKPAHHALIYNTSDADKQIGAVTSALWSPTCKRNIALAMLDAPHYSGKGEMWAEIYLHRELVWERRMCKCKIVDRPFFAPERRKQTPAPDR
jgi:aminomethyltransferase